MRPWRSMLFVPGHRTTWVEKAIASGADAITLDLEDSVPQELKAEARAQVRASIDWIRREGINIGVLVRVNGLSTGQAGFDMEAVVGDGVDAIFAPKVETALDVHRFETLLDYFEARNGGSDIKLVIPMETAKAVVNVEEIASASPRVGAILGSTAEHADVAREIGFEWTDEGQETLAIRTRVQLAARAAGVHPMTGLWERIKDIDGLREFCMRGRRIGFRGQIAIHPSHVPVINEVFGPDPERRRFFEGMIAAYETAAAQGAGAVVYEGGHIDKAHVDKARQWLADADAVESMNVRFVAKD